MSTKINKAQKADTIQQAVQQKYGDTARSGLSTDHAGVRAVAEAFGYSSQQLASIPAEANMGLSCGNPTAFASLKSGEVVVDLGCGGGLDVFLAAQKVGPTGKAIGIDMTPDMLALARKNAAKGSIANVEFHLATIDKLPLADSSVDCVISNCVINLAPDKPAVFREIARVLKPGGRLAVSDVALKRPLPPELGNDIMAYVGCIAGAIQISDYRDGLLKAGFSDVQVVDSGADLNAYSKVENQSGCCSPVKTPCCSPKEETSTDRNATANAETPSTCCSPAKSPCCGPANPSSSKVHDGLADLLTRYNVNDYAASVKVYALKRGTR